MAAVGGENIQHSNLSPMRVSRSVKRTPTRQQLADTLAPPRSRQRKNAANQNSMASKSSANITEEHLDRFVYERLFQKPKTPFSPEMPKAFFFDPQWLHKCEDCGDAFVNEATYKQHTTRRTMKISVKNDGHETELFYNRCNFLAAMRKTGRSQSTMDKSNIKVEPLIGDLAHLLHGGDLDEELLKKTSEDIRSRLRSSKGSNGNGNTFIKLSDSQPSGSQAQITDHFKIRVTNGSIRSGEKVNTENNFDMKCPECFVKIASRLRLKQHLDQESPTSNICSICQLPMPNECSLKAHERLHNTSTIKYHDKVFMCPECGLQFESREVLLLHIHQDCMHGFLNATFQCSQCSKLLSSSISLEAHLLNEHTEKVYKCTQCHLIDVTVEGMNDHIYHNHSENNKILARKIALHTCELCPNKYIKSTDILFHVHKHAEESDSLVCYVCAPCNIYVETKEEFRDHKLNCSHTVSKFCSLSFFQKTPVLSASISEKEPPLPVISKFRKIAAKIEEKPVDPRLVGKISVKDPNLLKRRKSDEDLPPAKKHCVKCGAPTKATKNTACMYCRSSRVSVLSDDSPFKQRLTITQRGVAVEEIDTEAFEDAILGRKKSEDIYECYLCKEKLINKYGDIEHHFQERHSINFTSRKINTKNFRTQLDMMRTKHLESLDAKFNCKICNYKTDEEAEFNRHLLEHKPWKPITYICKMCDISFAMKSCLIMHLGEEHQLDDVDEYLTETDQMIDRTESTAMKENQCKVCYKECGTALELSTHFRIHGMAFLLNKTRNT